MHGHRRKEPQGLVGPDPVVDLPEPLDLLGQQHGVGDLLPVQVLVLQALVEPLHHPVGLRGVVACPDMGQLGRDWMNRRKSVLLYAGPLSLTMTDLPPVSRSA